VEHLPFANIRLGLKGVSGTNVLASWVSSSVTGNDKFGNISGSSSGAENSPRARGSLPKGQRYRSELTPGSYPWPRFQAQPVDEDLIQKVVDVSFSQFGDADEVDDKNYYKTGKSSKMNFSKRRFREERPPLTSVQLAILVREKLNKECINLGEPPFNTKVSKLHLG